MNKLKTQIKANEKQIKNFLIYALTDGFSQALPFIVLPFIAEILGADQFGIIANLSVLVELYLALLGMRLVFYYSADYYQVDEHERSKLISNISYFYIFCGMLVALLTLFFTNIVAKSLFVPVLWQYITLFMVINLLLGQLLTTDLRLAEKAQRFGLIQLIRSFLSAGLSVLLVIVVPLGWEGRGIAMLVSAMFLGIVAVFYFRQNGGLRHSIDFGLQKKLLLFGLPMLPYSLSPWFKNGLEKVFITQQVSLTENGVYSLAITLGSVFGILSSSFFASYTPIMYKTLAKTENHDEGKIKLVKQAYFVLVSFLLVLLCGFFVLRFIIIHFFSLEYLSVIKYLPLILFSVWLGVIIDLIKSIIIFTKETKLLGMAGLILTLLQVPLTYFLISRYDTIGAPIAGLIGSFLMLVTYYYISQRQIKMPWLFFKVRN